MEASKVVNRSFLKAISWCRSCEGQSVWISRSPITPPVRRRPSAQKPFSTSTRRRQESTSEFHLNATRTSTTPSTSPPNSKQELQSYTRSIQKIIDGYNLKNKLPPRQHESIVVAVTNAEVRLDAPGAHPDSFSPLLKSLRGEVEPILKNNLGSSDPTELIADIGKRTVIRIQRTPAQAFPKTAERDSPKDQKPSAVEISKKLDAAFGTSRPPALIDSVYNYYLAEKSETREKADSSESEPTLPSSILERFGLADKAQREKQRLERERSLALQERLSRSDSAFLRRARGGALLPTLRLKPSLGRTVEVSGSFDVTRAFRSLEGACARNKVKHDLNRQRFHVRRGQMRKNLKMERWRRLFKEGFLAECERVRRLRRQGWEIDEGPKSVYR